jgi:hypothetical protein
VKEATCSSLQFIASTKPNCRGDVQKDMATRNDRGSDAYLQTWKDLYWLREKLSELTKYGFVLYRGDLPTVKTSQTDAVK